MSTKKTPFWLVSIENFPLKWALALVLYIFHDFFSLSIFFSPFLSLSSYLSLTISLSLSSSSPSPRSLIFFSLSHHSAKIKYNSICVLKNWKYSHLCGYMTEFSRERKLYLLALNCLFCWLFVFVLYSRFQFFFLLFFLRWCHSVYSGRHIPVNWLISVYHELWLFSYSF